VLSWRPFIKGPELIGGDPIDGIAAAGVGGLAEEQFATAVAVGIDRINEFHTRADVEMARIGLSEEELLQLTFEIGSRDECDLLRNFPSRRSGRRQGRSRGENEGGLVRKREIEGTQVYILKLVSCRGRGIGG